MHSLKLKILGCDNSTPLNRNLIPRFEGTRDNNKVGHQGCFETFDEIWFKDQGLTKVDKDVKD